MDAATHSPTSIITRDWRTSRVYIGAEGLWVKASFFDVWVCVLKIVSHPQKNIDNSHLFAQFSFGLIKIVLNEIPKVVQERVVKHLKIQKSSNSG